MGGGVDGSVFALFLRPPTCAHTAEVPKPLPGSWREPEAADGRGGGWMPTAAQGATTPEDMRGVMLGSSVISSLGVLVAVAAGATFCFRRSQRGYAPLGTAEMR
jgi:hypothetical protein